ncbi:MAG: hypothetical protein ACPGO3_01145 [Magnetospiraceae bacterium]
MSSVPAREVNMQDDQIWPYIAMATEGEPLKIGMIDNVWDHDWYRLEHLRVTVRHPHYQDQEYSTTPVAVRCGETEVVFAAVELSNSVYGFFAPDPAANT